MNALRHLWARLTGRLWRCGYCGRVIIMPPPDPGRPILVECQCGGSWKVSLWEGGRR